MNKFFNEFLLDIFLFFYFFVMNRNNTLRDILDAYDQYRRGYQSETKWIILLKNQILDYQHHQQVYRQQMQQIKNKYQMGPNGSESPMNAMEQEINELKSQFDPIAVSNWFELLVVNLL